MRSSIVLLSLVALGKAAKGEESGVPLGCGQTPIPPNLGTPLNLIVGGDVATAYSWPWQLDFCATGFFGGCSLECGASIIDNNWAITAGHCVYGDLNPKSYKLKAGVFDESQTDEGGEQVVTLKGVHLHPQYHPRTPDHDIALLELATPLKYSDHVQPVCIPSTDSDVVVPGKSGWVTGWGTTKEGGRISKQLRQVEVPFVDISTCEKEYKNKIQEDVMLCAGRQGIDSCQGDSGGPLVVQSSSGAWFQYGIVSFGKGCAEKGEPGIYSRVTAYCDFISSTTGGAVTCQSHN